MTDVKRYYPIVRDMYGAGHAEMVTVHELDLSNEDGAPDDYDAYVLASDYDHLEAERDEWKRRAETAEDRLTYYRNGYQSTVEDHKLRKENDDLRAKLATARDALELGWYQMGFVLHKHGEDWGVGDREGTEKVYESMNAALEVIDDRQSRKEEQC